MFSRRKPPVPGRIDTLVGRQTVLQGDLAFSGGLHVDGRIVGRVHAASGAAEAALWIGEQGSIEGQVEARQVVVHGAVEGDVHGAERVVLGATARIKGDVHYGAIEMTLGARVDGKLVPVGRAVAAPAAAPAAVPVIGAPAAAAPAAAAPDTPELDLRPFDARSS